MNLSAFACMEYSITGLEVHTSTWSYRGRLCLSGKVVTSPTTAKSWNGSDQYDWSSEKPTPRASIRSKILELTFTDCGDPIFRFECSYGSLRNCLLLPDLTISHDPMISLGGSGISLAKLTERESVPIGIPLNKTHFRFCRVYY